MDLSEQLRGIRHRAATSYIRILEEEAIEIKALLEASRKYPDGFKFYYPSRKGEGLDTGEIVFAELSGVETRSFFVPVEIWYYGSCLSLKEEGMEFLPVTEKSLDDSIAKFGIPS